MLPLCYLKNFLRLLPDCLIFLFWQILSFSWQSRTNQDALWVCLQDTKKEKYYKKEKHTLSKVNQKTNCHSEAFKKYRHNYNAVSRILPIRCNSHVMWLLTCFSNIYLFIFFLVMTKLSTVFASSGAGVFLPSRLS